MGNLEPWSVVTSQCIKPTFCGEPTAYDYFQAIFFIVLYVSLVVGSLITARILITAQLFRSAYWIIIFCATLILSLSTYIAHLVRIASYLDVWVHYKQELYFLL